MASGAEGSAFESRRWEDIDFDRAVILIRPKEFIDLKTGKKVLWKPKGGKQRAIPINAVARAVLQNLPSPGRWLFSNPASLPKDDRLSTRSLRSFLKGILKKRGLQGHLHTFRHSFISNALTKGIPEAIVRQWVGHIDPAILKLYTHIADQASQNAMQQLAWSNLTPPKPGKEYPPNAVNPDPKQAQIKHSNQNAS